MGREICCVNDLYFEYSTETDTIASPVLPKSRFVSWYLERYANSSSVGRVNAELKIRLARVEKKGTSSLLHSNLADAVATNLEGDDNKGLPFNEFCQRVLSLAEAPPEPEVKFLLPPKFVLKRIDGQIAYWAQKFRESYGVPIERSKAENYLDALQSVRELLFGERLDETTL